MPGHSLRLHTWSDLHNTVFEFQVDEKGIKGARGFMGPVLSIPYTVDIQGPHAKFAKLLFIGGWIGWRTEQEALMGLRIPTEPVRPNHMILRVPVTDLQIEMIEIARAGGPVQFQILLFGLAHLPVNVTPRPAQAGQASGALNVWCEPREIGYDTGMHLPVDLSREQWFTILEALGAGKRRLVEIPEPRFPREERRWSECVRWLDKAVMQHRMGDHEAALETGRKIVEGIGDVLCDHWGVKSSKSFGERMKELGGRMTDAWPEDKEAATLLSSLIATAWSWASPAHHYGAKIPARDETSFALSLCADLLMLSARLIDAHPKPIM